MFTTLLKEVGRGKRGARDLTYEEALEAADWIMNRKASPAQMGAFFIAERIKMESVEELEAFVHVCRDNAYRAPIQEGLDCAGPYDGRVKTFFASFATAFVLASAGLPVTLHGAKSLPPKWGVTLPDMLAELGIGKAQLTRDRVVQAAKATGVLFVDTEEWCPPLGELRSIREELGMRTVLNTAEKLIDFSHSPYLVFGVFHNTVFDRMSKLLTDLKYRRALIVQGTEGSEDLYIERPTRTYIVENGEARLHVIDPEQFGMEATLPEKKEWSAAEQVENVEAVLQGTAHIGYVNQVLLNAAVRLRLADRAESVEEALYQCKELLDSGAAWKRYMAWRGSLLGEGTPAPIGGVK
ncbi:MULTISPECIES: anthranilate phosphoribosyltransferase [unclassified Paenibacillus]|uniref:anthranilate phosphoribosyltransferase n=1 Tax=unclassified Paenibacillus TaxID=185978 RepID=UPI00104CED55|nr:MULTISPECIES: anthranilate phosphoribosyltransferase [unclassified Paenibacillus]NIK71153.1 anthranilate phosphoribosyltransferase [Paenibacillus sp. BK720]TCM97126.1 anthranilate phosphoribosyltransferase [Paenibacillus sp. BK033]